MAYTTKQTYKFVAFYNEHIRDCGKPAGIFKQIAKLLNDNVVTEDELMLALRNYANDEFRKQSDPRYIKHIRSFFTEQNILLWQTALARRGRGKAITDAGLATLDKASQATAMTSAPMPSHFYDGDDE